MICAGQGQGTTTSLCSTGHAGTMETGRLTTLLDSETSAVQDHHHHTNGEIHLPLQMKPIVMIGGVTTDVARTGIAMTGSARTKGGNVFHLRHQGMSTGTRMLLTSCLSANATTSEASTNDSRR